MQFKVPQDVQQADRIVSFLTFPQLIICIIGFAIAYMIYSVLNKQGLPLPLILIPIAIVVLFTVAFAFIKIANLKFHCYLALIIERLIMPTKRTWQKGADYIETDSAWKSPEDKKKEEEKEQNKSQEAEKTAKMEKIKEITDILDSAKEEPPTELSQIDKTDDKSLLQAAFLNEKTAQKEEPKKPEKAIEEKILEIGKTPIKRKRRRRRNKKKQNILEIKPEINSEPKPVIKAENKPEIKAEPKYETKTELKPEIKPEVKPEIKPEIEPKPQPIKTPSVTAPQTEPKLELKQEINPEIKPEIKTEPSASINTAKLAGEYSAEDLKKQPEIQFPTK